MICASCRPWWMAERTVNGSWLDTIRPQEATMPPCPSGPTAVRYAPGVRDVDECGADIRTVRHQERSRDPKQRSLAEKDDQRRHLRRPRNDRQAHDRGRRAEGCAARRLKQVAAARSVAAVTEEAPVQPPLPREPRVSDKPPAATEQEHDRERLVAVETDQAEGEETAEPEQREERREESVGPLPHP